MVVTERPSFILHYLLTRNQRWALMIGAIVMWGTIFGILGYSIGKPLISTSYYHANIQFRAGNEESYDDIFRQSLQHIVNMYDRHPTWKWTLECQGLLIQMAYENFTDIFWKIQSQNQRGQLELICPQYSHALAVAYTYRDFAESIVYNMHLLKDNYNLTVSNVIVLQEGQWLPAFPLIKHLGFDTVAISRDQLSYHNYFPKSPLVEWSFAGIPGYLMPLPWLPLYEGGVFHHQLALSDSERINTGDIEGPYEFNYNPDKMSQIELRHYELERLGNQFMTMSEWVTYCVDHGYVESMQKFLPESHWTPSRHQSVSRWMAWGSGESDDGIVHGRNFYTRNLIQTAEILLEHANSTIPLSPIEYANCSAHLLEAKRLLWLAQVTDTSGVNPQKFEFEYAINNTYIAQTLSRELISYLRGKIGSWQGRIQVQHYNRLLIQESSSFSNVTVIEPSLSIEEFNSIYGCTLKVTYSAENLHPHNSTIKSAHIEAIINGTYREFLVHIADFEFMGPRGEFITNIQKKVGPINDNAACNGIKTEQHMKILDNWAVAAYTPSLADNYTQKIIRYDYTPPSCEGNDDYKVPLPICNGLLYNDNANYAVITNNSVRHISVRWENDYIDFYENEIKYNARYEYIFFQGSITDALLLASIINTYPTWTLEAI